MSMHRGRSYQATHARTSARTVRTGVVPPAHTRVSSRVRGHGRCTRRIVRPCPVHIGGRGRHHAGQRRTRSEGRALLHGAQKAKHHPLHPARGALAHARPHEYRTVALGAAAAAGVRGAEAGAEVSATDLGELGGVRRWRALLWQGAARVQDALEPRVALVANTFQPVCATFVGRGGLSSLQGRRAGSRAGSREQGPFIICPPSLVPHGIVHG